MASPVLCALLFTLGKFPMNLGVRYHRWPQIPFSLAGIGMEVVPRSRIGSLCGQAWPGIQSLHATCYFEGPGAQGMEDLARSSVGSLGGHLGRQCRLPPCACDLRPLSLFSSFLMPGLTTDLRRTASRGFLFYCPSIQRHSEPIFSPKSFSESQTQQRINSYSPVSVGDRPQECIA